MRLSIGPGKILPILLIFCAGCQLPASMDFSPDGKHIAYRVEDQLHLLDASGKPIEALGRSQGGAAWSKDGSTLYFVAENPSAITNPPPSVNPAGAWALFAKRPGEPAQMLCDLPDPVWYMEIDPSEQWIAFVAYHDVEGDEDQFHIHAHHLGTDHAMLISRTASPTLAFTGEARLAIVEAINPEEPSAFGQIAEIDLIDQPEPADPLPRTAVLIVARQATMWIRPLGKDLLFTSFAQSLPGPPPEGFTHSLFHYTRASKTLAVLASGTGQYFSVSPDQSRILFQRYVPKTADADERSELAIMNANGSDAHPLREISPNPPMWPAWKSAEEIAFTAPAQPGQTTDDEGKERFEVMLYRCGKGESASLEMVQHLSKGWNEKMKPFVKIVARQPVATQPTTAPASP